MSRPAAAGTEDSGESTRRLRGRVQTMLTYADQAADPRPLVGLLEEVSDRLGADSPLALLVEYTVEELRSRTRSVAESARVWDDLHVRADSSLDRRDTTLMSIKALHARYVRLSGDPVDRDAAVQSYEVEWRRRLAILGARAHRTSTAHANLATALRERGTSDDLRRACVIARQEISVRLAVWGPEHSFTWIPQIILAQCLLKAAERAVPRQAAGSGPVDPEAIRLGPDSVLRPAGAGQAGAADGAGGGSGGEGPGGYPGVTRDDLARPGADLVAEGRSLAEAVVAARQDRFGPSSGATLRAQLVRAHALLLAEEPAAAVAEIRYVLATNRRTGANLDPGWPELLLARALLAAGLASGDGSLDDAVRQARAAVEARLGRYPAGTERVAEAERFEQEARRLASQAPRPPATAEAGSAPGAATPADGVTQVTDQADYGHDHSLGAGGDG
ncbi:hypothetical protein I6A60_37730 [Frankia sp. AgB1.9]|uniref:hypothetical protein n=1 Tax=unclassified Frankia TaxID=2632575 RepID=UPI001934753D|nr:MULTISPECIES: hypothetical protein [unclassified Frankia]MBL7490612.1 hypothetical protein [Frankia sp. AgW1.1]MBL7553539.1 hypothetical protein [Frankia sp. AgB1.9]MBL7617794.1 hypothetical protein [Frankia sp. AgB1.8]